MSSYRQPIMKTFIAGADLSAKCYGFVKIGASDTMVVAAGLNEKTVGVLMNAPKQGERAEVALPGGGALIKLTEAVPALGLLTPTATGFGEQCDAADEWCGAQIMKAGVLNDVVECYVTGYYASKSDV